jgi:hypothetical protein
MYYHGLFLAPLNYSSIALKQAKPEKEYFFYNFPLCTYKYYICMLMVGLIQQFFSIVTLLIAFTNCLAH